VDNSLHTRFLPAIVVLAACLAGSALGAQSAQPATAVAQGLQPASPSAVTTYTLPPDRYQKARSLGRIRLWATLVAFVWGVAALWVVLRWRVSAKFRTWAEKASGRRFVQALVFTPPLVLAIDVLELPLQAFRNWILFRYGLSVQSWASWFGDWMIGEAVSVVIATIVVWILYAVIRKAGRRWWFYFWLASLPMGLVLIFLQPLVIDPLFYKFEPLAQKEPALTASLEQMVTKAGAEIPPERMFWMGASEKLTALNAYVTGFGASKRIVVWDTTIKRMATPQIVLVAGHEMGHYMLGHIPKLLAGGAVALFVLFYLAYRTIDWILARWGSGWGVRGLDDWASLPALLLLFSIFSFVVTPAASAFSRHYEHEADQYGLEVTHGLTPDAAQACAQAFQILGDVNLADPEPSPVAVFLYYDHPTPADRMQFCQSYDPWSNGGRGEFVQ